MPGKKEGQTLIAARGERCPFTIVDSGHGTAVPAQAQSSPAVSSPCPPRRGRWMGLLCRRGAPQNRVGRRHVKALPGVVSVPVVQVATRRLLQGVEGVQAVGVLGGVEIEPELVQVLAPGVHHPWHVGCCQCLLTVLLPQWRQRRPQSLYLYA